MEAIEELKKKVENIEYKDIKELRDDVSTIKIQLERNNVLTEQNVESNKKLSETMGIVKDTMISMGSSIELNNENSKKLADSIEQMSNRFDGKFKDVDERMNQINNKGMIDTTILYKEWLVKLILGGSALGGLASIIYYVISKI